MAKQVLTLITDDIDGTEGAETVQFALDGVAYEIDLNDKNAAKLRAAFEKYIVAGTRQGKIAVQGPGRRLTANPPKVVNNRERNTAIREWAKANGHEIGAKGRIPVDIVEAYDKANR
jgi:hypothetical protein